MQLTSAVYLLIEGAATDVSPIIKAVTDPFSLLALIVLVLGLIATITGALAWATSDRA